MKRFNSLYISSIVGAVILCAALAACNLQPSERTPRQTFFIGIDASGSFHKSGYYDNAMAFLAHYIYGHMNEMGGLNRPREMFVGSIGGQKPNEPKTFHPIHDFEGKDVVEIEASLREWFPPTDTITDFNAFFQEVARRAKERNLILAPITVLVVSDGVPDIGFRNAPAGSKVLYEKINLGPMEYLSKNLTVRLVYASPKVADQWRKFVPRQRVRMWTVDAEVMKGWSGQMQPGADLAAQDRLWKWVKDNVDFRVRSARI